MKAIAITGVSTGIGYGATEVLIEKGFHVFGSVRKAADAERLVTILPRSSLMLPTRRASKPLRTWFVSGSRGGDSSDW